MLQEIGLKSYSAENRQMTGTVEPSLQRALDSLSSSGILIGHRLISPGDEFSLLDEEAHSIASRSGAVRRSSGAARIVGRQLLAQLGYPNCAVPKGPSGAPLWPAGVTGSFAHDDRVAVAVIGKCRDVAALGIDVESTELLPPELLELVATPQEQQKISDDPYRGRLLFAAKEAVYKAIYPLDQEFLDFHDVQVDLAGCNAVVHNGRVIELRFCISSYLVVVALA
jgi:4'-phosphopantetheinyl transferase EntD